MALNKVTTIPRGQVVVSAVLATSIGRAMKAIDTRLDVTAEFWLFEDSQWTDPQWPKMTAHGVRVWQELARRRPYRFRSGQQIAGIECVRAGKKMRYAAAVATGSAPDLDYEFERVLSMACFNRFWY